MKAKPTGKRRNEPEPARPTRKRLLWRFILLIIILSALFLGWSYVYAFAVSLASAVLSALGLGIIIVLLAVAAEVWVVWSGFHTFIRYWNWWLGGITLALAVWGLLAFFYPSTGIMSQSSYGGNFGRSILGASDFGGVLRLALLLLIAVLFIAPRGTYQFFRNLVHGLSLLMQGSYRLLTRLVSRPRDAHRPPAAVPVVISTIEPVKTTVHTAAQPKPGVSQQELQQVTQEAWKKYVVTQPVVSPSGWQLPSIDIMDNVVEVEWGQADNEKRAKLLEEALISYGVEAKVVQINTGPTVTQFGVEPGWDRKYKELKEKDREGNSRVRLEEVSRTRVKVERITSLSNDLALALAAPSIRIEAPVPGQSVVGVEIPNTSLGLVSLRSVIETNAFQKTKARSKLALALGKGAGGEAVVADLARMPHLLIAGATGSGKTVCLDAVITCLLSNNSPDDIQFIMLDPKRVELVSFNSIPHLVSPVVVDTDKAIVLLRWLSQEMDNRYRQLAQSGARNIEDYNKKQSGKESLPYLVLVVDELADLMMTSFDEVEHSLCRLAQLGRATGIHLVVATQRPSVDVVTGLIKANFPTRISFAVTSQVDSRTILDTTGAEKLLGKGDMLYMPTDAAKPKRLQGCYVSDAEIERLVYFWGSQKKSEMVPLNLEELAKSSGKRAGNEDSLLETARKLVQEHQHVSVSFLQRHLRIGYPRAARIMEMLEEEQAEENPDPSERQ